MKLVGFVAKHEKKILGTTIDYNSNDEPKKRITGEIKSSVLKYLAAGKYIFGVTLAIQDENGKYISPYIVYSDGEWLWPAYLPYYIESGNRVNLPVEFLQHVKRNNFEFPELTMSQEEEAKKCFMTLLTENNRQLHKK
jgi:hypothetical protein